MRKGPQNQFWRRNEQIWAQALRVIGPDGKQVGILSRDEALKKAQELSLDLVEVVPKANPPVAKIINFSKFLYAQEKKAREERKKEKKGTQLKEMWLRPFIAENDYGVRISRIKEFLAEGAKVRITIKPKSRIFNTKPLYNVMGKVLGDVSEIARVEQEPKMLGKQLMCIITQIKKGKELEYHENEK